MRISITLLFPGSHPYSLFTKKTTNSNPVNASAICRRNSLTHLFPHFPPQSHPSVPSQLQLCPITQCLFFGGLVDTKIVYNFKLQPLLGNTASASLSSTRV